MKKILYYVVLLLSLFWTRNDLYAQDAFYVYRNDGQFNAFFFSEVNCIQYSKIDQDSIECNDYVMQEIYTSDSIYRIPLDVIDSLSFIKPEIKLKNNVFELTKEQLSYLYSVDGLNLVFNKLPSHLYPKKNEILYSFNSRIPTHEDGYVAKVAGLKENNDTLYVYCDSISNIFEIFDQLIAVEYLTVPNQNTATPTRAVSGDTSRWKSKSIPVDLHLNYDIDSLNMTGYAGISGDCLLKVAYNLSPTTQYVNAELIHSWRMDAGIKINGLNKKFYSDGHPSEIFLLRFPVAFPIFKTDLALSTFCRGEVSCDLDLSMTGPEHKYRTSFTYDGDFSGENKREEVADDFKYTTTGKLSFQGNVQVGGLMELYFGTIKCLGFIGTTLDFYLGPKITGNFSPEVEFGNGQSIKPYNLLKDSKIGLSLLTLDIEASGEASFLGNPIARHTFFTASIASPLYNEWYLLPSFSDIKVKKENNKNIITLKGEVDRTLFSNVRIGWALYDKKGKRYVAKYFDGNYRRPDTWAHQGMEMRFEDLPCGTKFVAYPIIEMIGMELRANDSIEVTIDPKLETKASTSLSSQKVVLQGGCEFDQDSYEGTPIIGVAYTDDPLSDNWNLADNINLGENGDFSVEVSNLTSETEYYYCTYFESEGERYYGEIKQFTTQEAEVETIGAFYMSENYIGFIGKSNIPITEKLPWGDLGFELLYSNKARAHRCYSYWGTNNYFSSYLMYIDVPDDRIYYYRAYMVIEGDTLYGDCKELVIHDKSINICPDGNHPHAIDLGLPSGTKWSCCNIGANNPEGYGLLCGWGETSAGHGNMKDYQYQKGWNSPISPEKQGYPDIAGTQYDIAHTNWGSGWKMPSPDNWQELIKSCNFMPCDLKYGITSVNGKFPEDEVRGYLVFSPSGKAIYIPLAGMLFQNSGEDYAHYSSGRFEYWTSQRSIAASLNSWSKFPFEIELRQSSFYMGRSVRAISTY